MFNLKCEKSNQNYDKCEDDTPRLLSFTFQIITQFNESLFTLHFNFRSQTKFNTKTRDLQRIK